MKVPLLDVNAQNAPLHDEVMDGIRRVVSSGAFILGPEVESFEAEIAAKVGTEFGIGVSSGTDAVLLALMALGIGEGDEVLVPAFTFFATAGCVSRLGAVPVFVDVCPVCFNIDVAKAEKKITGRTKAIVPVHLFGQCAEMDGVAKLASEHGIQVVEDAAQAIGATYRGKGAGSMGDLGAFSFYPTKNLGAMGDAGMVVTNDADLASRARVLRNHGMEPRYYHSHVGGNFRLDAFQAVALRAKLKCLDTYTGSRQQHADRYLDELGSLDGVVSADLTDCCCEAAMAPAKGAGISCVLPIAYPHCGHVWNQFTLRVLGGRREKLREHLQEAGVGSEVYYPLSLSQQECFQDLPPHALADVPVAEQLAEEVLSIPVFPEMTEEQQAHVSGTMATFFRK